MRRMINMRDKILSILEQIQPEGDFEESDDFFEDELLDSMGIMAAITMMEQAFSITISPEDIVAGNFQNVLCIEQMLERYLV